MIVLQAEDGQRVIVRTTPFSIGRHPDNDLTLLTDDLSSHHAELRFDGTAWSVTDLHSRNGTFINAQPVRKPTPLSAGDQLQLGRTTFRARWASSTYPRLPDTRDLSQGQGGVLAVLELARVIGNKAVVPLFQPILQLGTQTVLGWEALARPQSRAVSGPAALLELASTYKQAPALCQAFEESAADCVRCGHCWPSNRRLLFLNVHADRIKAGHLESLLEQRAFIELSKRFQIVLEIPEALACEATELSTWVAQIRKCGALVAYDDFGKGQSRITELIGVPPDFIKLDRALIADLDQHQAKLRLVKAMVETCISLGIETIAEGVETAQELSACQSVGIELGQGYVLGRPSPAYALFQANETTLPESCPFVRFKLL